jgi:flagellin FlaB
MTVRKRGEMGVGTLILFLALILVAAIAAGVLLITSGELQSGVLETGDQARSEVASMLKTIDIFTEDGTDSEVEYFFQSVKLVPGAEPLRFDNLLVTLQLFNESESYTYNSTINCENTSTIPVGQTYGIHYNMKGESYRIHRISDGDIANICYQSPRSVREGESVRISLLPTVGSTSVVDTLLPDVIVRKKTAIYPKADSFI